MLDIDLFNYEKIKPDLFIALIGAERNNEMIKDMPHTDIEDLSLVYYIRISEDAENLRAMRIDDQALGMLGVDRERLHRDAVENSPKIRPAEVTPIGDLIRKYGGTEAEDGPALYVVTTETANKGAAALFYPGVLQSCAEMLGGDYWVLPSSVHEMLLLPDDGRTGAEELREMVAEVNRTAVDPSEQLTDSVYRYDAKERVFELASKYEDRRDAEHRSHARRMSDR